MRSCPHAWLRMIASRAVGAVVLLLIVLVIPSDSRAAGDLTAALEVHPLAKIFPDADHAGVMDGSPPAASVFRDNKLIGYVFLTSDVISSAGYSGKPVKILAGVDLSGHITGAVVYQHQEPILVLGVPEGSLDIFIAQMKGADIRQRVRLGPARHADEVSIDMVTGATITSLVFSDSIMRAARKVARARGIISEDHSHGGGAIDNEVFYEAGWAELLADGSLRRLQVTKSGVDAAFSVETDVSDAGKPFIDLFAGLASPAAIGQNLLGFAAYNKLMAETEPGASVIFVAAQGFYSFRGYNYRRTGVFERLQLIQGDKTIQLNKPMHHSLKELTIAGAPDLREISLLTVPPEIEFNPTSPWRLDVLVERDIENLGKRFASFPLNYILPARFLRDRQASTADAKSNPDRPLWEVRWLDSITYIAILGLALAVLLVLLIFQDWLVRYRDLMDKFRIAFLVFTLIFVGWIAAAQLSVINVLTFIHALLSEFRWDFFLLEPLIFVLWGFVALALLFWGRGVFCGWLCPFGALQELINRLAVHVNIRQFTLPFVVNERLWPIKYVFFLGLLALTFGPTDMAEKLTEVEPFKTAIALKFVRAWPFVAYAVAILAASIFINRIFCRYLCPLGAALAIPANNRMFDWLKRRHQCGVGCQICSLRCPVQAIHPSGEINSHECIYCLDCQSIYHDDHMCPPLVETRKRRERRQALSRGEAPKRKEQPA